MTRKMLAHFPGAWLDPSLRSGEMKEANATWR